MATVTQALVVVVGAAQMATGAQSPLSAHQTSLHASATNSSIVGRQGRCSWLVEEVAVVASLKAVVLAEAVAMALRSQLRAWVL